MTNVLIKLEDDGQDLTRLLATQDGRILDAEYGHRSNYEGAQIIAQTDEPHPRLILTGAFGRSNEMILRWPVIEQVHTEHDTIEAYIETVRNAA